MFIGLHPCVFEVCFEITLNTFCCVNLWLPGPQGLGGCFLELRHLALDEELVEAELVSVIVPECIDLVDIVA